MELFSTTVLDELHAMYRRRGSDLSVERGTVLREIGFRSLDLSELALRLEDRLGRELNFRASEVRRIETVDDLLGFFDAAAAAA
jgi:acyl carrier protein